MERRRHGLRLREVATRQHIRLDVESHEYRGIAEIGELDLAELAFDEGERPARLDQIFAIDLLAAKALQLFGDRMDCCFGEIDDELAAQVKAAGALIGIDVAG